MALDLETRNQLLDAVRRFITDKCRPREAEIAEADAIPEDLIAQMRVLGIFGLSIPEEFGGLGLNMEEEALIALELGRTSPAVRSTAGTNIGIGSQGLIMFGNAEQKAKWLPQIASGEVITSFCLTETNAGSDAASVQTRAIREGDYYRLNGTKRYITNGDKAHLYTVMVRTDPDTPGAKGMSAFLVERVCDGVSTGSVEKKMGQQGTQICDVIFDDVKVPVSNRLGKEGEGFKLAMSVLDRGRLHIAAVCTGVAERLISDMVHYAMERQQFGKPIAEHQLIQAMLADSQAETYAARCMILDTAKKYDADEKVTLLASSCKLFASEMVGRVADRAVQVFGGAGYVADYGIERLYRDVRIFRLYEGTSQIQQIVIARELVKAAKLGLL